MRNASRIPAVELSESDQVHISSLVVHCRPEFLENTEAKISALPDAEVHANDDNGKLIVVLETKHEKDILNSISMIENIEGVLGANMVFHQID